MGSKEKRPPSPSRLGRRLSLLAIVLGPRWRWMVIPIAVVLAAAVGLRLAWQAWGERAMHAEEYILAAAAIDVTPQPEWIHTDVKSEVVRSGGLEGMPIRDPNLVKHVHDAFAMHGWVAKVNELRKHYPARVTVDLEYRRPVAMVEVAWRGRPSLFFVDAQSVLLPKEDHDRPAKELAAEYRRYLRIDAGEVSPAGRLPGTVWDNPKIVGAAHLAALGGTKLLQMGAHRIVVTEDVNGQPLFELETESGGRVIWGSAPGKEASDEPAAESKLAALAQFVARHGTLDKSAVTTRIDLRRPQGGPSSRTAAGNGPASR